MLTIPESVKTLYKTDGVRKNFRAHFPGGEMADITNANIVRESLHFTESLCSQNNFRFGLAEASVLEVETVGVGNMYGMTIQASIEIDVSSLTAAQIADIQAGTWDGELVDLSESDLGYGYFRIPLGVFRVEKCPRNHGAMTHRKVTAYSADQIQEDPFGTIPGMPAELPRFRYYTADVAGVTAAGSGDGLTKTGELELSDAADPDVFLYDSAGTKYRIRIHGRIASQSYAPLCRKGQVYGWRSGDIKSDFIRAATFDKQTYYTQGMAILSAIDSADIDFTYNSNRKKIFNSNSDALLASMPYLLSPYVIASFGDSEIGVNFSGEAITPIQPATYHGILSNDNQRLFTVPPSELELVFFRQTVCWMDYSPIPDRYLTNSGILIAWYWEIGDTSYSGSVAARAYLNEAPPIIELFQGTATGIAVKVDNSGPLTSSYFPAISMTTADDFFQKEKNYSYANTVDYPKLVNGCYELKGQFAKTDRMGGFEAVELSPASPLAVVPGDYNDAWWDEYDVAPIGSVVVTSKGEDGSNTPSTVTIGDGASVYDMSDNDAMSMLEGGTLSNLGTLLAGDFAANAVNVGFTPIEMTMQGWPWLEAGDALRITAEDGTIVNTYALRVEMDGMQHLMATITAEGGEIVGET